MYKVVNAILENSMYNVNSRTYSWRKVIVEFENLFNTQDPKIREIVEKYKQIRAVYDKIQKTISHHRVVAPGYGSTIAYQLSNSYVSSLTATVRF